MVIQTQTSVQCGWMENGEYGESVEKGSTHDAGKLASCSLLLPNCMILNGRATSLSLLIAPVKTSLPF